MEDLYAKLYNKYEKLKKKQLSELDELNRDQEVKFLNYVSVAEEIIQHLQAENDRLREQVIDLRSVVASIRSTKDEQRAEFHKLLMEENQKNKILNGEVERLQSQLQDAQSCNFKDGKNYNVQLNMLEIARVTSGEAPVDSTRRMTKKRIREAKAGLEEKSTPMCGDNVGYDAMETELAKHSSKEAVSSGDLSNDQQLECCKRPVCRSGRGNESETGPANCQFRALFEYLVGMKLSTVNQTDGVCISALHQSSGYSFTLTRIENGADEEPDLLYRVLTLGMFERIAPEWMQSVLMFSTRMCPIFFERVARVTKGLC